MSHEITIRENGQAEFAFAGEHGVAWHGLGSPLPKGATIDEWVLASGLEWNILEKDIFFKVGEEDHKIHSKKALIRSDDLKNLSVVSSNYRVVQPKEVLEFFRDLVESHGFEMSAAGSLFGGTRFWATARVGLSDSVIVERDKVESYLLLVTSADGTLATTAKLTSTRVVCNNTMQVALHENSQSSRVTHRALFNPEDVKIEIGVINESWDQYMKSLRTLAESPMSSIEADAFFKELEFGADGFDPESRAHRRKIEELNVLRLFGPGSNMSGDTKWGALNAVTHLYTHGPNGNRRSTSSKFWDAYMGEGAKKKQKALDLLLDMV